MKFVHLSMSIEASNGTGAQARRRIWMSMRDEALAQQQKTKAYLGEKYSIVSAGVELNESLRLADRAPKVGDLAAEFTLPDASGTEVSLATLLGHGPVVLTFYRGSWCPYCNIQLNAYQQVQGEMMELGATLVAVSPEKPEGAADMIAKHQLTFPVLTDGGNAVARQYGLEYMMDDGLKTFTLEAFKNDLGARNVDGTWRIPMPGTFVIDRGGVIRYSHVDADYLVKRAEPEEILAALRELA